MRHCRGPPIRIFLLPFPIRSCGGHASRGNEKNKYQERHVNEPKLSEFEFCEILWGHRIADLVVNDSVKSG